MSTGKAWCSGHALHTPLPPVFCVGREAGVSRGVIVRRREVWFSCLWNVLSLRAAFFYLGKKGAISVAAECFCAVAVEHTAARCKPAGRLQCNATVLTWVERLCGLCCGRVLYTVEQQGPGSITVYACVGAVVGCQWVINQSAINQSCSQPEGWFLTGPVHCNDWFDPTNQYMVKVINAVTRQGPLVSMRSD